MTALATDAPLPVRGYLLHLTHYDPRWCANKAHEEPFDLAVGRAVVDAVAAAGLNLLLIDPKDAVAYASHPELRRPYTQPMDVLAAVADHARARGLEVAIKLNFSQSGTHQHNHWFAPHHRLFDNAEYFERAGRIMDELIAAARPPRFFHLGMDEDHDRSVRQYLAAVRALHGLVKARGLQPLVWNDSACQWPAAEVHQEKSLAAELAAPGDLIHVLWDYAKDVAPANFARLRARQLRCWGAPGGPEGARTMAAVLRATGGEGMLLTRWAPCIPANRDALVAHLREVGPLCR